MKKCFFTFLIILNTAVWAQLPGNALVFDGINDYVDCGNDASLNINAALTLEAWVKTSAITNARIISKWGSYSGYEMAFINDELWFTINQTLRSTYSAGTLVNQWTHLAVTYDGTNSAIYVNGNLENTGQNLQEAIVNTGLILKIGQISNSSNATFSGSIDEVRIWNRKRSQEQIQSTMNSTLDPKYYSSLDSGLVGYWQFEEGVGDTAHDLSVYGNHGIIHGAVWSFRDEDKFRVTNNADSGNGSFRQALLNANASPGMDTITFQFEQILPVTITLQSPLPTITDSLYIAAPEDFNGGGGENLLLGVELDGSNVDGPGLNITSGNCQISGLVINRFSGSGILISGNGRNTIRNNIIGLDPYGKTDLGNGDDGITIDNSANNVILLNLICGNTDDGILLHGSETNGNQISWNNIGVTVNGDSIVGNGDNGIQLSGDTKNNFIGPFEGTLPGKQTQDQWGNQIAGNGSDGISIVDPNTIGNRIQANLIGLGINSDSAWGNGNHGIFIGLGANDNLIGGESKINGNVISGNSTTGIWIDGASTVHNRIQNNLIGTGINGISGKGNDEEGIRIQNASQNEIIMNVISDNGKDAKAALAIIGASASENIVRGNYIGTDINGTTALGNYKEGIFINAPGNYIGSESQGEGNIIAGNLLQGIYISEIFGGGSDNNKILGNYIGLDVSGTQDLGNGASGILISDGSSNLIGSSSAFGANIIAFNNGAGVNITGSGAINNELFRNRIFSNSGLGIDLQDNDITENDIGDSDNGPNGLQNYPVLTSAQTDGDSITIIGSLNSTANMMFRFEFFANSACDPSGNGEGKYFLNEAHAFSNNDGNLSFTFTFTDTLDSADIWITATVTDSTGNTSEFSQCVQLEYVSAITDGNNLSPLSFFLAQNHPNPFNPTTTIMFTLPRAVKVTINLYNTSGQKVESLISKYLNAGVHELEFNASNLPSGIYFYRIRAGEFQDVKKMILIK